LRDAEIMKSGDYVFPTMPDSSMGCCDCGLVHKIRLEVFKVIKVLPGGGFEAELTEPGEYRVKLYSWRDHKKTEEERLETTYSR